MFFNLSLAYGTLFVGQNLVAPFSSYKNKSENKNQSAQFIGGKSYLLKNHFSIKSFF
jgi:hypothetical protein